MKRLVGTIAVVAALAGGAIVLAPHETASTAAVARRSAAEPTVSLATYLPRLSTLDGGADRHGYWLVIGTSSGSYAVTVDVPAGLPSGFKLLIPYASRPHLHPVASRGTVALSGAMRQGEAHDVLGSVVPMRRASFIRLMTSTTEQDFVDSVTLTPQGQEPRVVTGISGNGAHGGGTFEAAMGRLRVFTPVGPATGPLTECAYQNGHLLVGLIRYDANVQTVTLVPNDGSVVRGPVLRDTRIASEAFFAAFLPHATRSVRLLADGKFVYDINVRDCVND